MNAEWSDLNKLMQIEIKKKETFNNGINTLLKLREELMYKIMSFKCTLKESDFNAIPYINAKGYHNKTIAYSLYHVFRIEDIVANSLIKKSDEIFFSSNYKERMNTPIITTGNELKKDEILKFSSRLNIDGLYEYIKDVDISTTQLLKELSYDNLKMKISEDTKESLKLLDVVSEDKDAFWLIDYWCSKDIYGLLKMPFSRHWIMHIEASARIESKLLNKLKRGE